MDYPNLYRPFRGEMASEVQVSRMQLDQIDMITHKYLIQLQEGRLHPERIPVGVMERVLDMGCGTGEWVFDLARRYPRLHIYGVDVNEEALHQARVRRNTGSLRQVELRQMDFTQPLTIPDQYLDFVHVRNCARTIEPSYWPVFLQECTRILRPGGWVTLVETEFCEISSPAGMVLLRAIAEVWPRMGQGMDRTGMTFGAATRLYGMLQRVQLEEVSYELHSMDLGILGGSIARHYLMEGIRWINTLKPLIVQLNILESSEFDELQARTAEELQSPDLCGWGMIVSASGRKPVTRKSSVAGLKGLMLP